ncbi:MAG: ABC transporter permease subunit, partial [Myxococcota bacterium]
ATLGDGGENMRGVERTRWVRGYPGLFVGLLCSSLLLLVCVGSAGVNYDPVSSRYTYPPNLWPSWRLWLGTDHLGQPLLTLVLVGTQSFFLPGVVAACCALFGGVVLGSCSGYYGGLGGGVARYLSTLLQCFPHLIFILLGITIFGSNMYVLALMMGVLYMPRVGDEIHRKIMQLKSEDFVLAARAHGLSRHWILFRHLLWSHCLPLILRQLVFLWGALILLETSIRYLAGGSLSKTISWGQLLYDYRDHWFSGKMWSPFVVTFCIVGTMVSLYLLADGLQHWSQDGSGIRTRVEGE